MGTRPTTRAARAASGEAYRASRLRLSPEEWAERRQGQRRAAVARYYQRHPLVNSLRVRLCQALKDDKKAGHTLELVGCSLEELRAHLERQFLPGMSWSNYGEWHVDHSRPCAQYNLSDPVQQRQCFHWSNLQPLWAEINMSKGAR